MQNLSRRFVTAKPYALNILPHANALPSSTSSQIPSIQCPCFLQWVPTPPPFLFPCLSNRTCTRATFCFAIDPKCLEHTQQSVFGCTSFALSRSSARGRLRNHTGSFRGTLQRTLGSRRRRARISNRERLRTTKPDL